MFILFSLSFNNVLAEEEAILLHHIAFISFDFENPINIKDANLRLRCLLSRDEFISGKSVDNLYYSI